ncbi:uncharacterized protein LOC132600560 isoform X2 [Lycium barbarum]|uniref:uncharacterized protein LOC132600554 isoform X2 n=1 Tax=Lycium barbarum TaxID=112863 RepID=UPI00293ED7BA|nr:uncharacterized protein LOC132600554 isoform X2 [Lycium barbarum]XP_060169774.1 uncharacterized protein LOC132600554 isoform X2 [Lycium barbarum]XP_060169792.1 uncharacterized protein LOC132600560 isoform X2 [Lycium barbarum]XP_060169793.1 uncharacterized protein LOC132600560 isoform X2 [Lycium barbarum]
MYLWSLRVFPVFYKWSNSNFGTRFFLTLGVLALQNSGMIFQFVSLEVSIFVFTLNLCLWKFTLENLYVVRYFSSLSVLFVLFSRFFWGYKMTQLLGIYAITLEIPDWTCKVCSKTYSSVIQELKRSFLPLQLLGDILLYCSDYVAMTLSVSSRGNLRSLLSLCKLFIPDDYILYNLQK